mgnify:CR=1 FL=1
MLLKKELYTSDDYWNLPEGERAELINGQFYAMAPPSRIHQELVMELSATLRDYIKSHGGNCKVYPSPFAVNLDAEDNNWVEPDISIICDKSKLTDRGCSGAPDLIVEIVSPSSRKMDYVWKAGLYMDAGVREYWIVDIAKNRITVYNFNHDYSIEEYSFTDTVKAGIYEDLSIDFSEINIL